MESFVKLHLGVQFTIVNNGKSIHIIETSNSLFLHCNLILEKGNFVHKNAVGDLKDVLHLHPKERSKY